MITSKIAEVLRIVLTSNPNKTITSHISELLSKNPINFSDDIVKSLPEKEGVYLIFKISERNKFIYVGETRTIKGRLTSIKDARMRKGKPTNHTFIGMLNKKHNEFDESKLRQIIRQNYMFSYVEVESKEMAFVIEGIIQRIYGSQLWNKPRKAIKLI